MFNIRGTTAAICMKGILYDFVTNDSKLPVMSHSKAAGVVIWSQARKYEKAFGSLKDSHQFVNGDKESLKAAKATDSKLDC